jgi:hypothetical protein
MHMNHLRFALALLLCPSGYHDISHSVDLDGISHSLDPALRPTLVQFLLSPPLPTLQVGSFSASCRLRIFSLHRSKRIGAHDRSELRR